MDLSYCQGRFFTFFLEEYGLLVEPLFFLLLGESIGRLHRLLPSGPPLAVVVVAHGDYQEVAVSAFSDACHDFDSFPVDLNPVEAYFGKHNIP